MRLTCSVFAKNLPDGTTEEDVVAAFKVRTGDRREW